MIEGSPNYALHNFRYLIEHSLTPPTLSPKLRSGERETQSGRLELTPLPLGDRVPDLAKQERGEGRGSMGEGSGKTSIYTRLEKNAKVFFRGTWPYHLKKTRNELAERMIESHRAGKRKSLREIPKASVVSAPADYFRFRAFGFLPNRSLPWGREKDLRGSGACVRTAASSAAGFAL